MDFGRDFGHFFQIFLNSRTFIYRGMCVSPVKRHGLKHVSRAGEKPIFFSFWSFFWGRVLEALGGLGELGGCFGMPWGGFGEAWEVDSQTRATPTDFERPHKGTPK